VIAHIFVEMIATHSSKNHRLKKESLKAKNQDCVEFGIIIKELK